MCGLKAEEERDDDDDDDGDDDKRGPVTVLIPHQEAVEECHKAADMSLRQPTSTLDRYEPHIHSSQTVSASGVKDTSQRLAQKCSTPRSANRTCLYLAEVQSGHWKSKSDRLFTQR